jgi:hypothetical protein
VQDNLIGNWTVQNIEKTDSLRKGILGIFEDNQLIAEGEQLQLSCNNYYQIIKENGKMKEDGKWTVNEDRKLITLSVITIKDSVEKIEKIKKYELVAESEQILKIRKPGNKNLIILNK